MRVWQKWSRIGRLGAIGLNDPVTDLVKTCKIDFPNIDQPSVVQVVHHFEIRFL